MTEHVQRDGVHSPQGGLAEEVRALRSKVAKLERATSESEGISEAYRSLVDDSAQGLAIIQDGRIVFANQKMAFITGYSVDQLRAMSPEEINALVHPEDRQTVWSRHRDRLEGKVLPNPCEFRGIHKDGHVRWLQLYAGRITYHGRAAVQGAYVDVTDYRQVMHALEESEQDFRLFYERSPLGYQSLDPEGRFIQVNPAWLELLGYEREEVIGRSFGDFVAPAMRREFPECFHRFKRTGQVTAAQWEMVCKDGRVITVELDGRAVFNSKGDFDHSHCVIRDVTAREKALRALRESEERYRTLVEGAPVSILVLQDGRYVYANPVGARKLGYENPVDIVGKEPLETIDPDYHAAIQDRMRTATKGARNAPMELKVIAKDGTARWMESASLPITRDGRSATLIVGQDITERKETEAALKESEDQLKRAQQVAHVGSWSMDFESLRLTWSDETYRIFGLPIRTPLTEKDFLNCIHPDDFDNQRRAWAASLQGAQYDIEHRIINDGMTRWVRERAALEFSDEGKPLRAIGTVQDITERKQAMMALEESEEKFQVIADYTYDLELWVGTDGRLLWMNSTIERFTGYTVRECMAMADFPARLIHPEDRARVLELYQEACQGSSGNDIQFRVVHQDGTPIWISASWQPIYRQKDNTCLGWRCSCRDISDRVRTEQALREATMRQLEAVKAGNVGLWDWDLLTDKVSYSAEWKRHIGYEEHEIGSDLVEWRNRVHPDDLPRVLKEVHRCIGEAKQDFQTEFRFRHKDGSYRWILAQGSVLQDASGQSVRMYGSHVDITERKQGQLAVQESEEKFRSLFESMSTGCCIDEIVYDNGNAVDYRILDINPSYEKIMGIGRSQAVGLLGSQVYGTGEPPFLDTLARVAETGEPTSFESYFEPIGRYLEFTVSRPAQGRFSTVFSDITQRKATEELMRRSEELFSKAFHGGPLLMTISSIEDGTYIEVNDNFVRSTGYSREEAIGSSSVDLGFLSEEDRDRLKQQLLSQGQVAGMELALRKKSGETFYCMYFGEVVTIAGEQRLLSIAEDITARKRTEEELHTSQEKLTTIFDSVPVMMLVVDGDRRVVNANRAALEASGYSAEQIEGLRGGDAVRCVHALDAPEGCGFGPFCQECTIRRLVVQTLEDGISHHNAEARLCVMAGEQTDERIFQTSTARIDTVTERLALICLEDITDRKRAEEALRHERDRAQGYLDTVESIVVALDQEGRITLINKKGCRLFGYREEELVGRLWFAECLPQPEGIDKVYPRFLELVSGKLEALEYVENPIIDRTGEVRQIAWHNALLRNDEGRVIGTLSSGEDITERKRAEQAMRESAERHRLLFENASLGIGYFDPNGRVIAFNAIAGAWMGADPKSFVGKSLVEMYGQEAGQEYQRRIENATHSQTAQVYEDRVVLPADERWLMSTYTRITNATGEIVGVQIISADITDRKQAEMALQESEDKYHSLFSEMSSGCALHEIICDAEGAPIDYRTLEVNKTFEALLETQNADVVGKRASEILPQEELRRWLDVFAPVALTGESCHYEMHSPTNDKWFDGNAFCPEPGTFAVTFSDVTRRKQAEIDLERHRAELEAIYEHTPALLCVLDEDRRVLYANRAFTDFTGVSESELKAGRACGVFGCVNATSDPRGCGYGRRCQDCSLYQALEDTLRTGISHRDIEYRATLERHGSQREVVMLGATALVRTSDRSNLLLCLQDVTEQEQAQERSKQREAELLHVSRLSTLGEMVSGFSHELNQPLSAVLNYGTACIRLVESDHPDMKRVAGNLAKIVGQAERARDIMGRIRALAQRHQPDLTSVDLNHAIANVVDLLSWESRRKQIEMNLDLDEQLPPIRADVIQIEQVLLNLIRNALDAMEETDHGQRLLTIRTRVDKSGLICAEVCDRGVGLPKGAGDRIFEAFFTTKPHGLGIGLSISRTIMEMHGGTLEVRENDGRGCTFVVSFPTVSTTE